MNTSGGCLEVADTLRPKRAPERDVESDSGMPPEEGADAGHVGRNGVVTTLLNLDQHAQAVDLRVPAFCPDLETKSSLVPLRDEE